MDLQIGIKRTDKYSGIEGILLGFDAQEVETAGRVDSVREGADQQALLVKLETHLDAIYDREDHKVSPDALACDVTEVLTPAQISQFIKITQQLERKEKYKTRTGTFISKLIQLSYENGNNSFELDLMNLLALDSLGTGLEGTAQKPINLMIRGVAGHYCGHGTVYTHIEADRTESGFGHSAKNSTFTARTTGAYCGLYADHSTFTLEHAGKNCGAFTCYSTYKTSNRKTLKQILKTVSSTGKIIYIQPNGKEKIERDYR